MPVTPLRFPWSISSGDDVPAPQPIGVEPLAEYVSYGMVAGPDNPSLLLQPANAIRAAPAKTDLSR